MPRGPKPTKALFIVGRVRVVQAKSGRFRVLWYDRKQRERSATTLERAKEIAREVDAELEGIGVTGARPDTPFGELVLHAVDPKRHQWSPNWARRQLRYANYHILPTLGKIECARLDKSHMVGLLDRMLENEYSKHTIDQVRKVLVRAVMEGVRQGIWDDGRHPMVGVKTPDGGADGKPKLDLIPTHDQVEELIDRMWKDRPIYGAMAEVSAFTGVRWGELLALRSSVVDLDEGNLTVNLVCVEDDTGRFVFRQPSKSGASRTTVPARTIPLETRVVDLLGKWITDLRTLPKGPHVDSDQPRGLLFQARNGNPIRRSHMRKVFWRHASQIDGWPEGASWHYLRHYCATRWINPPPGGLGIEVPTVSKMLGHQSVTTTYEWYVDVDREALERARARMP